MQLEPSRAIPGPTVSRRPSVIPSSSRTPSSSSAVQAGGTGGSGAAGGVAAANGATATSVAVAAAGQEKHRFVGNYEIVRTIGEGSFARVKLAVHRLTNYQVAIKSIEKVRLPDEYSLRNIHREAQIMAMLDHPHIIRLYEVMETRRELCLVVEHAPGGELLDYIVSKGRLDEEEARVLTRQVVDALAFCHGRGVVHRDLKAENILLDARGRAKLSDFGLSNVFDKNRTLKTCCGSPVYSAPELIEGKRYIGPEVDMWSLGINIYAMVVGDLPFADSNITALYDSIMKGVYDVPDFVSPDCRDLISKLLTINPKKRLTITQVRAHPWITAGQPQETTFLAPTPSRSPSYNGGGGGGGVESPALQPQASSTGNNPGVAGSGGGPGTPSAQPSAAATDASAAAAAGASVPQSSPSSSSYPLPGSASTVLPNAPAPLDPSELDGALLAQLGLLGFDRGAAAAAVAGHRFNAAAATYHILAHVRREDPGRFARESEERAAAAAAAQAAAAEGAAAAGGEEFGGAAGIPGDVVRALLEMERAGIGGAGGAGAGGVVDADAIYYSQGQAGARRHAKGGNEGGAGTGKGNGGGGLGAVGGGGGGGGAAGGVVGAQGLRRLRTKADGAASPLGGLDKSGNGVGGGSGVVGLGAGDDGHDGNGVVRAAGVGPGGAAAIGAAHRQQLALQQGSRVVAGVSGGGFGDVQKALARQQAAVLVPAIETESADLDGVEVEHAADGGGTVHGSYSQIPHGVPNAVANNSNIIHGAVGRRRTQETSSSSPGQHGAGGIGGTFALAPGRSPLEDGALTDMLLSTTPRGGSSGKSKGGMTGFLDAGSSPSGAAAADSHHLHVGVVGAGGGIGGGGGGGAQKGAGRTNAGGLASRAQSIHVQRGRPPQDGHDTLQTHQPAAAPRSKRPSAVSPIGAVGSAAAGTAGAAGGGGGNLPDASLYIDASQDTHPEGVPDPVTMLRAYPTLRVLKYAFNLLYPPTGTLPDVLLDRLKRHLEKADITCKPGSGGGSFCLECEWGDVTFEAEVCKVAKMPKFGVRVRRIEGDMWDFKRLCGRISADMTGGAPGGGD